MADLSPHSDHTAWADPSSFYDKLNHQWHKLGLQIFMVIVLAHWAEHLAQPSRSISSTGPNSHRQGVLGLWFPG